VIGFVEVLKKMLLFLKLKKKCEKILSKQKIDCFIPIDYPGFNFKLAKFAVSKNIPVFYYIAPQLWAWGKNRWKKLKYIVSELLVVFPFEEKYFNSKNIKTTFVGHPLLDNPNFDYSNVIANESLRQGNLISFFPGSREQEVTNNLELFANVAKILSLKNPEFEFGFAVSPNISQNNFEVLKKMNINYKLFSSSNELMLKSKIGIVKAGTSTLEAALLNMNMIVAYKTSKSHFWLGKKLINIGFIALPNILANKRIIPEFIQTDANPAELAAEIQSFYHSNEKCDLQKNEYFNIRQILGNAGASKNAAKIILERLKN
jgi:lipid-A-disaccharide synthase